jgi:hypothetical protein
MAIGSNPCGCADGIGTCEEAWICIQTHICEGRGLSITGDCLGVALGSCLGFDGQGRIAWVCGEEPEPGPCQATVDTLLADGFFIGGKEGGSSARAAWASPQAIDYALANQVAFIECHAFSLTDGPICWSGMSRAGDLSLWTANGTVAAHDRSSNEWVSITSDPGTLANPTGRNKQAPATDLTPDGGYFGYYMPPFSLLMADDALRRIDGRAVVNLDMASGGAANLVRTQDINNVISTVSAACAQTWTMVTIGTNSLLGNSLALVNAGITCCVNLVGDTTTTPATITASDATWVRMEDTQTDARITSFVAAGLNVLLVTNSRHIETIRAESLGAAGIVCIDPVYARDTFRTLGFWNGAAKGTAMGVLDYFTDQKNQVTQLSAMGYARTAANGLWVHNSPTVNASIPDNGTTQVLNFKNLGMLRFGNATEPVWEADLDMRFEFTATPTSIDSWAGIVICAINDADFSGVTTGVYGGKYLALRTGYLLRHILGGPPNLQRIQIYRFDGPTLTFLAGGLTQVSITSGVTLDYDITVTSTGITFASGAVSVSVNDATYRGRYFKMATSNSRSTPGTFQVGVELNPNLP